MRTYAQENGLQNTVIINTCAVTNEAERQSRQAVRRAKRSHPNAKIIVTGCSAQINPQLYESMPEVDKVLGNHEKMLQKNFTFETGPRALVTDIMEVKETAAHLISGFENHARAFIQIQNGCDHRCTFCSIPYGRGNNRSLPVAEIVKQVQHLVDHGCLEVVLTGVDITGYGSDLPAKPSLGQLVRRIFSNVPNLPRLRLSSLDPVEVDETLFELMAQEPRLMPHLHLSLQAGNDLILKRMKRRHLSKDVIEFCQKMRRLRPNVVFGADIIAGFPTETDEMFADSLKIAQECDITYLHVFPYSARQGTPASRMPQVPGEAIKERATRLRELGKAQREKFYQSWVGQEVHFLMESNYRGHTDHFAPIRFRKEEVPESPFRQIVKGRVIGYDESGLIAQHTGY